MASILSVVLLVLAVLCAPGAPSYHGRSTLVADYPRSGLIKEPVTVSGPQPSALSISAPVLGSNSQPPAQQMRSAVTLITSNLIGVGTSDSQRKTKSPGLILDTCLLTITYSCILSFLFRPARLLFEFSQACPLNHRC